MDYRQEMKDEERARIRDYQEEIDNYKDDLRRLDNKIETAFDDDIADLEMQKDTIQEEIDYLEKAIQEAKERLENI